MKSLRPLLLASILVLPALAMAQWQWLDKDGKKVFSDRPPPADIAQNRILKQPGGAPVAPLPAADGEATSAAAKPPVPSASALKVGGKEKALEDKKKQAEAAEAEKLKAEDAKRTVALADNCARAKQQKATLESGVRVARTNAKGEREFIDDSQRAAEVSRLSAIVASDCK